MENSKQAPKPRLILLVSFGMLLVVWLLDYFLGERPATIRWESDLYDAAVLVVIPVFVFGIVASRFAFHAHRVFGSKLLGAVLGILSFATLYTAYFLCFLRLIRELDDNMRVEGYSSVMSYAWGWFCIGGVPLALFFFTLVWGIPRVHRLFPSQKSLKVGA